MSDEQVWVPHPELVWVPGKCRGGDTFETDSGDVVVPKPEELESLGGPQVLEGVDDCCTLSNVTPGAILHTVRQRYGSGSIYTNVANVLIAVNPFRPLDIYSTEYLSTYREAQDLSAVKPHIFGLCSQAWNGLMDGVRSQSVLISGESGAGKTETTKLVLFYTSAALAGQDGGLEDLLMEINPVLEAFGNAKTVRNNNSSRFGKWIEVKVNPATRNLLGVTVIDYLLEVTRVCGQGPGERNYHIFYQLANDEDMAQRMKFGAAAQASYLKANGLGADGVDDQSDLRDLRRALATLGFDNAEEDAIFDVVGAILHIGNLDFDVAKPDEATIATPEALASASALLRVDPQALSKVVCFKRVSTGKDVVMSPLDAQKARNARDSVAKLLYGKLFTWLVFRCNEALGHGLSASAGAGEHANALFLGVLDIAGFESFETNMFEQLLINLSNEKLQQFFNHTVFKCELEEYGKEGVPVDEINFVDNADVLDLIEKAGDGLLAMLDDATSGVRQTDASFTEKACKAKEGHARFMKPKFSGKNLFGIRHYAGEVWYTTDGFLKKNVASAPQEVLELMRSSEHDVVKEMGAEEEPATGSGGAKVGAAKKKATVGASFKRSLQQLMDKLNTSECNFVRCIKPNQEKVSNKFNSPMVMDQLRLCGVMETVKIRKAGFSSRMSYQDFAGRYLCVVAADRCKALLTEAGSKQDWRMSAEADAKKVAEGVLAAVGAGEGTFALGHTKTFLKASLLKLCEDRRKDALAPTCVKIQAHYRGHFVRRHMKEVLEIHKQLMGMMKEAGHALHSKEFAPRPLRTQATAHQALEKFDSLLLRASSLPVKIAYLQEASKVRAFLAAEEEIAEEVEMMQDSINLIELQALLAHIANFHLTGEEVERLAKRVEELKKEAGVKRALQNAVTLEDSIALKEALTEAKAANLGERQRWLTSDGAEMLAEAEAKLAEIEAASSRASAAGRTAVEEALASTNPSKIQEALELIEAGGFQVDAKAISALKERATKLKDQVDIDRALQTCVATDEEVAIKAALHKAEAAGLGADVASGWLLPNGAAHYAEAKARLAESSMGKAVQAIAAVKDPELANELKKALRSTDVPAMQSLLARHGKRLPAEAAGALQERIDTLQVQIRVRRRLMNAGVSEEPADVVAALREVEVAGLAGDGTRWILPDAPRLVAALKIRAASLQDIRAVKERIAAAAKVYDYDELSQAIAVANALGLQSSEYISSAKIHFKMQNLHQVKEYMEHQEVKTNPEALSNLRAQLDRLEGRTPPPGAGAEGGQTLDGQIKALLHSTDISAMQGALIRAQRAELKSADVEALKQRSQTLQAQGPHLRALRNVLFEDDDRATAKTIDAAKAAGLDQPGEWLMPDGPKAYAAAVDWLQQYGRRRQEDADAQTAIPALCAKLMDSVDLGALRSALDRAEMHKVQAKQVDDLRARAEKLDAEMRVLRQLRNCVVYDQAPEVERCVKFAADHGLSDPAAWMLPDGPAAVENAKAHLEKILAMHSKEDITKADITRSLELLKESTDLVEIQQTLARAHVNGVQSLVVMEIENRAKTLKEQKLLVRDLKNCLVFEGSNEIQEALDKVRAAGLGSQDGWLFPQGPQLYSQALARMIFCDKCQVVMDSIMIAASLCDSEAMETALRKAQDLGVPERKYAEAYDLFMLLQNAEYVEGLLQQLRLQDHPEPEDFKRMANLASQMEYLGVKPESRQLKDVASRMVQGRTSAVFKTTNEGERYLAKMVFEDFQNFSRLRDPVTWNGGHQAGGADPIARGHAMMSWQPERITEPLTKLPNAAAQKAALIAFEDIMRCMGDKPTMFVGNKEQPVLKALQNGDIVDEVYLQVVKQCTCNPSSDSCVAGWRLLKFMLEKTPPSRELTEFVYCWCQEVADPDAAAQGREIADVGEMCRTTSATSRRRSSFGMAKTRTMTGTTAPGTDGCWSRSRRRTEAALRVEQVMKDRTDKAHAKATAIAKEVLDIIEELPMGKEGSIRSIRAGRL